MKILGILIGIVSGVFLIFEWNLGAGIGFVFVGIYLWKFWLKEEGRILSLAGLFWTLSAFLWLIAFSVYPAILTRFTTQLGFLFIQYLFLLVQQVMEFSALVLFAYGFLKKKNAYNKVWLYMVGFVALRVFLGALIYEGYDIYYVLDGIKVGVSIVLGILFSKRKKQEPGKGRPEKEDSKRVR